MRSLNKKIQNDDMTVEAFASFCSCTCSCGCEHVPGSQSLGISYSAQGSSSTSYSMIWPGNLIINSNYTQC